MTMKIKLVLNFVVMTLVSQIFRCNAFQFQTKATANIALKTNIDVQAKAQSRNNIKNIQLMRQQLNNQRPSTIIFSSNSPNTSNSSKPKSKSKSKGVYSRPSAAIEKGSGFFVPGLEGSKVRIVFGALVLVLNYVNHAVTANNMKNFNGGSSLSSVDVDVTNIVGGLAVSEKIATFYGIFLLFQGLIEFAKEVGLGFDGVGATSIGADAGSGVSSANGNGGNSLSSTISSLEDEKNNENIVASESSAGLDQFISSTLREKSLTIVEAACWTAASYLSLTPATHIMLLEEVISDGDENSGNNDVDGDSGSNGNGVILYRLGDFQNVASSSTLSSSITAAVEAVYQSRGGRVSIPSSHPGATLLPEESRRCVLLQKVYEYEADTSGASMSNKKRVCLLVGSDQLLAAFTKNDLKWLGSLGSYLMTKFEECV